MRASAVTIEHDPVLAARGRGEPPDPQIAIGVTFEAGPPPGWMPRCCRGPIPRAAAGTPEGDYARADLYCAGCGTIWARLRWPVLGGGAAGG